MNRAKPPFSLRYTFNLLTKTRKKFSGTQTPCKNKLQPYSLVPLKDTLKASYYAGVTFAMLANCFNNELGYLVFLIPGSALPARKCIAHLKSIMKRQSPMHR